MKDIWEVRDDIDRQMERLDREHDLLAARLRFDDLPQPIRRNGRRVAAG